MSRQLSCHPRGDNISQGIAGEDTASRWDGGDEKGGQIFVPLKTETKTWVEARLREVTGTGEGVPATTLLNTFTAPLLVSLPLIVSNLAR